MPEEPVNADRRVDAVLRVMREPPIVARADVARIAARAVLADSRAPRSTVRVLQVAAALAIVASGGLLLGRMGAAPQPLANAPQLAQVSGVGTAPVITRYASADGAATPRPIVFELDAPAAHSVQVLGDFNDWSRGASSMQRGADGRWRLTTLLPPGRYVYTFLVDDNRFTRDPARDAVEDKDFGVTGSEVVVGEAP